MKNSSVLAVFILCLAAAACRRDMHIQPKYIPLDQSDFFSDNRSERPEVEGTVARGHLRIDKVRYTGKDANNNDATSFPFPITKQDMERGQERFDIYCSPCHGRLGDGNGMIVRRGFHHPPSYHTDRLIDAPVGHFFDVMTNGFGAMASYASRVSPDDRWRIAAYIRVLQLSQSATMSDVPADRMNELNASPPTLPAPTGITPAAAGPAPQDSSPPPGPPISNPGPQGGNR